MVGEAWGIIRSTLYERTSRAGLSWIMVRRLGRLQILTRASYTALLFVPTLAYLWGTISSFMSLSGFPNGLVVSYVASISFIFAQITFQIYCPESVQTFSEREFVKNSVDDYKEHRSKQQLFDAREAIAIWEGPAGKRVDAFSDAVAAYAKEILQRISDIPIQYGYDRMVLDIEKSWKKRADKLSFSSQDIMDLDVFEIYQEHRRILVTSLEGKHQETAIRLYDMGFKPNQHLTDHVSSLSRELVVISDSAKNAYKILSQRNLISCFVAAFFFFVSGLFTTLLIFIQVRAVFSAYNRI